MWLFIIKTIHLPYAYKT